jgi:hypothetical protein
MRGFGKIYDPAFAGASSEPAMIALDEGAAANGGNPPASARLPRRDNPQPRKHSEPRTNPWVRAKGLVQGPVEAFHRDLGRSGAIPWGALDNRIDPEISDQHGREEWPAKHFGVLRTDDWGAPI